MTDRRASSKASVGRCYCPETRSKEQKDERRNTSNADNTRVRSALYIVAGVLLVAVVVYGFAHSTVNALALTASDLFAGGSIRLPRRAAWLEEFTSELLAFPGRHDDQVDALTQALAWGRKAWAERASWGYLRGLN